MAASTEPSDPASNRRVPVDLVANIVERESARLHGQQIAGYRERLVEVPGPVAFARLIGTVVTTIGSLERSARQFALRSRRGAVVELLDTYTHRRPAPVVLLLPLYGEARPAGLGGSTELRLGNSFGHELTLRERPR
jgi:hypothetical protein